MSGPSGSGKPDGSRPKKEQTFSKSSDSPQSEIRYVAIGRIVRAHGIRGEVSVAILTDFPERFDVTEWVYLGDEFEAQAYRLEKYRWHKKNVLLTLDKVKDRTQAEKLQGLLVQVPLEESMPLPEGSYYLYQLMGLQVITTDKTVVGNIVDILETGANDVYVVRDDNNVEILLPAIPDVVQSIDLEQGLIIVQLIDGLI